MISLVATANRSSRRTPDDLRQFETRHCHPRADQPGRLAPLSPEVLGHLQTATERESLIPDLRDACHNGAGASFVGASQTPLQRP